MANAFRTGHSSLTPPNPLSFVWTWNQRFPSWLQPDYKQVTGQELYWKMFVSKNGLADDTLQCDDTWRCRRGLGRDIPCCARPPRPACRPGCSSPPARTPRTPPAPPSAPSTPRRSLPCHKTTCSISTSSMQNIKILDVKFYISFSLVKV